MQVILRQDIPQLGKSGEVVKVAPGYARNYLIPKRLAYRFTEGVRRQVETESRARAFRESRDRDHAEELARRIRELGTIRFRRKAGESGSLFGSVTNVDIAAELEKRGVPIDRRVIRIDSPIKRVGSHQATVHLLSDLEVEVVIEVDPEQDVKTG